MNINSPKYFLSVQLLGEKLEREVTLEQFCSAERGAGFRPKMSSTDPRYMSTPATGGFSDGTTSGRIEYE